MWPHGTSVRCLDIIEVTTPKINLHIWHGDRNVFQTYYIIRVAIYEKALAHVWRQAELFRRSEM